MIKINLSSKIVEIIKQKHRLDFFKNTRTFEDIKMHLIELRNAGYENFTNLFINQICGDVSREKIATLLCIDSKKMFENFV